MAIPRSYFLPVSLALCTLITIASALPQISGLNAIGVKPAVDFSFRIFSQGLLFAPLLIFHWLHRSSTLNFLWLLGLAVFALLYAHFPSPFFDYIWDVFLIESIFIYLISEAIRRIPRCAPYHAWPFRFLLFKLMFCMGLIKFLHGMPEWHSGTALRYFWANQPMPAYAAWYASQLPEALQKIMVFGVFIAEIAGPLLIFAGNRSRIVFFWINIGLQLGILISGNYGIFNLLTIVIGFSLLEQKGEKPASIVLTGAAKRLGGILSYVCITILSGWLLCNIWYVYKCFVPNMVALPETNWIFLQEQQQKEMPAPLRGLIQIYAAAKASNPYALFGMIPKYRMEIALEGSQDQLEWRKYRFFVRPDVPEQHPIWYAPHHWRLDHQFYYESFRIRAPRKHEQYSFFLGARWMPRFIRELCLSNAQVSALLKQNPFPAEPPRFFRLSYLYYSFTTLQEYKSTGAYWKTERPHQGQFFEKPFTCDQLEDLP